MPLAHLAQSRMICAGNERALDVAGVPTLSLDHCGMHDTIDEESGIRIPIHSYEQCVKDIAKTIDKLLGNPNRFKQLSDGVVNRSKQYTWDKREKVLLDCYQKTIENHKLRKNGN